jgi:proteasome alpha subunit
MQGQSQQQAYDRGITIFSPDGRLYQVEYAREAVKRGTASIGVRTSDGVVLVVDKRIDFARREAQVNQLRYGEPIGVETLTKAVTDHIQQYTQVGGARPFGVALIIGGIADGEPRLYETVPSGTPYEWQALAIGADRSDIHEYLEDHYDEEMALDEGVGLALEALASVNDDELSPEGIGVATITVDDETFVELSDEEKTAHLEELDLLADDEDEDDEDIEE